MENTVPKYGNTLGSAYTGSVPFRTVQMGTLRRAFTWDALEPFQMELLAETQMGPLTKSIPFGTVPRKVSCKRVEQRFHAGTARK